MSVDSSDEYLQKMDIYVKSIQESFKEIDSYNTKVATMGYATFFGLSTLVDDVVDKQLLVYAVSFISISVFFFVFHEVFRMLYFSRYISSKAKSLEFLPDTNPLMKVDSFDSVVRARMQKWNAFFAYPSVITGLVAVIIMMLNYILYLSNIS